MNGGNPRFALVTGTSHGIGEAVARFLLEHGWNVAGIARHVSAIEHASYEHLTVDLQDTALLSRDVGPRLTKLIAQSAWERVGLVNNAALPGLLGPISRLDIDQLGGVLAVNVIAPIWLMGVFARVTPPSTPLRIVNLSSAAAVRAFAGLGAYGGAKAALRMAGMVFAAEAELARGRDSRPGISILSYEPGAVDTPMQAHARATSVETLPSLDMFERLAAERQLIPPEVPARDIVAYLESDPRHTFEERRYGVGAR